MKRLVNILTLLIALVALTPLSVAASEAHDGDSKGVDPKEVIFDHLGDGYGWEVPFNHHKRIPLPVILFGSDGLHCFSSAHISDGKPYKDGNVIFQLAPDGDFKGKVIEISPDGKISRPFDISITKNVLALFIAVVLVILSVWRLKVWYKRHQYEAPRRGLGLLELIVDFIYGGVIKATLKEEAPKFAPYLLTVFFLILYMNLLGLLVVFPGGANLTGNIAVTLVLALFTFFITNLYGTKHYWKEILWPDVPIWLKCPIPIMQIIEIFGMFTKPAALTVRLFANMMGGHMIVIVLTLLIFIFADMGAAVIGATTVMSMIFSVFMLLLDTLVSFIQAYVFTMLSTIFIALAREKGHHEAHAETPVASTVAPAHS
ncbi:MAG: F0F1 ATP synthase subunit A [Muribaculaceae bacterium]|nr:F0F1 ATP synthase subunit A [Muribaculaceae bacterium]MDE6321146.1 F0F1 ATP synthase subunit A [Muribaculaceae bacterium]